MKRMLDEEDEIELGSTSYHMNTTDINSIGDVSMVSILNTTS